MDIFRAEKIAQDRMLESRGGDWNKSFVLVGPAGVLSCEWLDPYFGMFTIQGTEGFAMTKQIPPGVECLMPDDENETAAAEHS